MTTHGHSRRGAITKTYRAWRYMIQRCERPNHRDYRDYGGRGITICREWHKFESFLREMGCAPIARSLGRIDNDGPYCKANCEWQTAREQAANTRRNRNLTLGKETHCVSGWARRLGVPVQTFYSRVVRWGKERAFRGY